MASGRESEGPGLESPQIQANFDPRLLKNPNDSQPKNSVPLMREKIRKAYFKKIKK